MSPLLQPLLSNLPIIAAFLVLLVAVKLLGSPAFKGWLGEMMVIRFGLRKLDPALYQTFHDLYLPRPDGQGSTQIDHVVVSPFGIFVIETKNYRGWIFGSENAAIKHAAEADASQSFGAGSLSL
ncbi:MAG: nuclease-related domain-containing protein [Luteolibacter sp.]|uniref:nuclease-related domain-containing protein n=1 Tax=Luteolibacter sp. TaxID=1962973 RepID=UPI0032655295